MGNRSSSPSSIPKKAGFTSTLGSEQEKPITTRSSIQDSDDFPVNSSASISSSSQLKDNDMKKDYRERGNSLENGDSNTTMVDTDRRTDIKNDLKVDAISTLEPVASFNQLSFFYGLSAIAILGGGAYFGMKKTYNQEMKKLKPTERAKVWARVNNAKLRKNQAVNPSFLAAKALGLGTFLAFFGTGTLCFGIAHAFDASSVEDLSRKLKIWGPKKKKEWEIYFKGLFNMETDKGHNPEINRDSSKDIHPKDDKRPSIANNSTEILDGVGKSVENIGMLTRVLYSQETINQMEREKKLIETMSEDEEMKYWEEKMFGENQKQNLDDKIKQHKDEG